MFGGNDNVEDFDLFIRQFENLIDNKAEDRRDDRQERAVQELIKLANGVSVCLFSTTPLPSNSTKKGKPSPSCLKMWPKDSRIKLG